MNTKVNVNGLDKHYSGDFLYEEKKENREIQSPHSFVIVNEQNQA